MFKFTLLTVLVAASYLGSANARTQALGEKHSVSWRVAGDTAIFEVTYATNGWVGFGLSESSGMWGGDCIVGGVKADGTGYLADYHIVTFDKPELDAVQNYELLGATENGTHTYLMFSRPLVTGDDDDWELDGRPVYFLWSHGVTDDLQYHGPNRGAVEINDVLRPDP